MTEVYEYVVVGAGLAGLTLGYEFSKRNISNYKILEARNHTGGRILTTDHIDLGATWFQDHHVHLKSLIEELELPVFRNILRERASLFIVLWLQPSTLRVIKIRHPDIELVAVHNR